MIVAIDTLFALIGIIKTIPSLEAISLNTLMLIEWATFVL